VAPSRKEQLTKQKYKQPGTGKRTKGNHSTGWAAAAAEEPFISYVLLLLIRRERSADE